MEVSGHLPQTSIEHPIRKSYACFLESLEQLAQVFGRMGKIQDAQRIRSMPFRKRGQHIMLDFLYAKS